MRGVSRARRLSAILNADVMGYSRLMGDDETATVAALNAHRLLVGDLVAGDDWRVVDATGDNTLAEFPARSVLWTPRWRFKTSWRDATPTFRRPDEWNSGSAVQTRVDVD